MRLTEEPVVSPEDSLKVELKYYLITMVLIVYTLYRQNLKGENKMSK